MDHMKHHDNGVQDNGHHENHHGGHYGDHHDQHLGHDGMDDNMNGHHPSDMDHTRMMDNGDMANNTISPDHHHSMSGHMQHGMKMYFHSSQEAVILFSFWHTSTCAEIVLSCLGIFVVALLYERLKVYRESLLYNSNSENYAVSVPSSENGMESDKKTIKIQMFSRIHLIQTILHVIQIVISYFLMLIFMTYNVWLCLAVALGAGAGYFVSGYRRPAHIDFEHCH